MPAELPTILQALEAYRPQLKAVAVESTFNWYWLVDGLQAANYPVHLANPAAMEKYSGLKQTDDETDALVGLLSATIDGDRYPLSPRIQTLKSVLAKIRPAPVREPLPPLKHYEPPRAKAGRRRR